MFSVPMSFVNNSLEVENLGKVWKKLLGYLFATLHYQYKKNQTHFLPGKGKQQQLNLNFKNNSTSFNLRVAAHSNAHCL